jgi:molecular chaperone DnaK (HSP70)
VNPDEVVAIGAAVQGGVLAVTFTMFFFSMSLLSLSASRLSAAS